MVHHVMVHHYFQYTIIYSAPLNGAPLCNTPLHLAQHEKASVRSESAGVWLLRGTQRRAGARHHDARALRELRGQHAVLVALHVGNLEADAEGESAAGGRSREKAETCSGQIESPEK